MRGLGALLPEGVLGKLCDLGQYEEEGDVILGSLWVLPGELWADSERIEGSVGGSLVGLVSCGLRWPRCVLAVKGGGR